MNIPAMSVGLAGLVLVAGLHSFSPMT
jgi:hypothetical protein